MRTGPVPSDQCLVGMHWTAHALSVVTPGLGPLLHSFALVPSVNPCPAKDL